MAKIIDEHFEQKTTQHGKKPNQKLKPYLVMQYLLKESNEDHPLTANDIVEFLKINCGIYAERRSVYTARCNIVDAKHHIVYGVSHNIVLCPQAE